MNKQNISRIVDRYMSIFIHGSKSISSLMSYQLRDQLSIEQFSLLRTIRLYSPIRASELAKLLYVHRSTITVNVDKLVKKGFIERQRDENDRRNVFLSLSDEGKQLLESIETNTEKFAQTIIEQLTQAEVENFLNVFEKIAHFIEGYGGKKNEDDR